MQRFNTTILTYGQIATLLYLYITIFQYYCYSNCYYCYYTCHTTRRPHHPMKSFCLLLRSQDCVHGWPGWEAARDKTALEKVGQGTGGAGGAWGEGWGEGEYSDYTVLPGGARWERLQLLKLLQVCKIASGACFLYSLSSPCPPYYPGIQCQPLAAACMLPVTRSSTSTSSPGWSVSYIGIIGLETGRQAGNAMLNTETKTCWAFSLFFFLPVRKKSVSFFK